MSTTADNKSPYEAALTQLPRARRIIEAIEQLRAQDATGALPTRKAVREHLMATQGSSHSDTELHAVITAYSAARQYRELAPTLPATVIIHLVSEIERTLHQEHVALQTRRQEEADALVQALAPVQLELETALNTATEELGRLKRQLAEREHELALTRQTLEQQKESHRNLAEDFHRLDVEKRELTEKLARSQTELTTQANEHKREVDQLTRQHSEALTLAKEHADTALAAVQTTLGNERGDWRQTQKKWEKREEQFESQLASLREQLTAATNAGLEKRQALREQLARTTTELSLLQAQHQRHGGELSALEGRNRQLLEQNQQLMALLSAAGAEGARRSKGKGTKDTLDVTPDDGGDKPV